MDDSIFLVLLTAGWLQPSRNSRLPYLPFSDNFIWNKIFSHYKFHLLSNQQRSPTRLFKRLAARPSHHFPPFLYVINLHIIANFFNFFNFLFPPFAAILLVPASCATTVTPSRCPPFCVVISFK